jgi:pyruvate dehydrogenase E2 component (dihydrolipoamide acetyltransferase)
LASAGAPAAASVPARALAPAPAPAAPAAPSSASISPTPSPESAAPAGDTGNTAPVGSAHVSPVDDTHVVKPHASPGVRKFARELGVDLHRVRGSGPKQRITQDDVRGYVKGVITAATVPAQGGDGAALGLIAWPKVDFAKFGPIDPKPLSRIKKLSGANLHRNWVMIPHVTNNDEADITDLEEFRVSLNKESDKTGVKYTMLGFLIKAVVAALKKYPEFNSSLDGDQLVYKNYYHIGFAADTPNGLVVPVLKDADKKGLSEIAKETSDLAKKARDGKLSPAEMQGGTFSISSLGGIGGTHFTPIINAPEVAILGVSKSYFKPVWNGKEFITQLTLPLSLSYDHRVIDGAAAARFNNVLRSLLSDFRRAVL